MIALKLYSTLIALGAVLFFHDGSTLAAQSDAQPGAEPPSAQVTILLPTREPERDVTRTHAASTPTAKKTTAQPGPSAVPDQASIQSLREARVTWDSRGLEIVAFDSSLNQILLQVASQTGAKLDGLAEDQRVFGSYGPGTIQDVLWALLQGSGYNVLMAGDSSSEAAREIVLSARPPVSPRQVSEAQKRSALLTSEPRTPDPPPAPSAITVTAADQNPFSKGEHLQDQMKFMQEVLLRQKRMDNQRQDDGMQ